MPSVILDKQTFKLRWARQDDLKTLVALDRKSGREDLWSPVGIRKRVAQRCVIVLCVPATDTPIAAAYFFSQKFDNRIIDITVHEEFRGRGLGTRLLEAVQNLKGPQARQVLTCYVRESELRNQNWLKKMGFTCFGLNDDGFECPPEPAYIFYRNLESDEEVSFLWSPRHPNHPDKRRR